MKLPKELTTVTPVSKFMAFILFITFPFLSFLYGMKYQELIDFNKQQDLSVAAKRVKRIPTPTPDLSKTALNLVRNQKEVQEWLSNTRMEGKPVINIDHKEGDSYIIQVYEDVSDSFYPHITTFNSYRVNEKTWEVTKETTSEK